VPQRAIGRQSRGAEEHNRVADTLAVESVHRLEVFGEDAQGARIVTVEEPLVLVGDWFGQLID